MRSRFVLAALAGGALLLAVVIGCQTYDFEPVQPLVIAQTTQTYEVIAKGLKPNLMLLVDKSGSMLLPIDPNDSRCPAGCGTISNPCPGTCPTRWGDLQTAMDSFLRDYGSVARMGLAVYPGPRPPWFTTCGPAATAPGAGVTFVELSSSNDVPSELQTKANEIRTAIQATSPAGGTPTGSSIEALGAYAPLSNAERDDFILLLTDGLPNCNPENPNRYDPATNSTVCRCTDTAAINSCAAATPGAPYSANGSNILCLDKDGTVAAINGVRTEKEIRTIVVGFGAETASGAGPEVLQAMAEAGGFPRRCPGGTPDECGGGTNTCDTTTKTCSQKFFQASDAVQLGKALADIIGILTQQPCDYDLSQTPSNPAFLTVLVDGQPVARGTDTWEYRPPGSPADAGGRFGKVVLVGSLCARAQAATKDDPLAVEIRLLQSL